MKGYACLVAAVLLILHVEQSNSRTSRNETQRVSTTQAEGNENATDADWPSYGGTYSSWRYSALNQINTTNIKKLLPAWIFQTGDYKDGLQATPIVIDGVVYISDAARQVFALDGATGRVIWQYKYPFPRGLSPFTFRNRGVAVGDGKVFVGTYDDFVVALDQKTGHEVWKVAADDPRQCNCSITGAPLVVKDKVIVGEGGEMTRRGYLTAFNTETGRLEWRFYTIPGPGEKGNETWQGDSWKYGDAAPWTTGSYDPKLNLVYWGIGNPDPALYSSTREGDNLYSSSVVALDADTGKLRWYHQEVPKDVWDYDSNSECVLMDREVRGRMRKLLVHFAKPGFAFVLDRETGEFLGAYPYVDYYNWISGITESGELVGRKEPVIDETTFICPSNYGGKNWNQTAYSPRTGLIYVPVLEICNDLMPRMSEPTRTEGRHYFGGSWVLNAPPGHDTAYSHIDALDPVSGKKEWSYQYKFQLAASILATAGDLVFTGDPEGYFFALDAHTGQKLWDFQTGASHRGSSVTYMVGGRQYVATPTGVGSGIAASQWLWPEADKWKVGSTLVVFALPEDQSK